MKKEKAAGWAKAVAALACMIAAGLCYSCSRIDGEGPGSQTGTRIVIGEESRERVSGTPEAEETLEKEKNLTEEEHSEAETSGVPSAEQTQEPEEFIYVHVCGQVVSPGVYQLLKGSRVYEAVAMAGGCTEQGAPDCLNMAQELTDGMKIQVPDQETARRILEEQASGAGVINPSGTGPDREELDRCSTCERNAIVKDGLSTASREQLTTLPGIGESRAEDIIRYREEYGGFQKIEDIMKVSGIKEAAFQKIKDRITV